MRFALTGLLLAAAIGSTTPAEAGARSTSESIFDHVSHIEARLHLDIPQAPRLCDRLKLKKRKVNVGDCELYVEEEGSGMPLVLLHGGPGATHHYFHPFFSRAKGFARVIYYDQRGCGQSGFCPGKGYTVAQAADDLENLRKALDIKRWIVLGHSYGGLLAQYYALRHPASLAGLVLVGSSLGMHVPMKPTREGDFMSAAEKSKMPRIELALYELVKQKRLALDRYRELRIYNEFLNGYWKRQNFYKPSPTRVAQIALYEWKQDTDFNESMSRDSDKIDLQGAFADGPIPTLVAEGKWDLTWNTDKPGLLRQNHPGSKLVMFENSSHHPFRDEPGKFFSALKEFLGRLPPAP